LVPVLNHNVWFVHPMTEWVFNSICWVLMVNGIFLFLSTVQQRLFKIPSFFIPHSIIHTANGKLGMIPLCVMLAGQMSGVALYFAHHDYNFITFVHGIPDESPYSRLPSFPFLFVWLITALYGTTQDTIANICMTAALANVVAYFLSAAKLGGLHDRTLLPMVPIGYGCLMDMSYIVIFAWVVGSVLAGIIMAVTKLVPKRAMPVDMTESGDGDETKTKQD